ncbi:MAG: 5'-nucleotidase C-terminal domain-containing protein [Deltaproteobacteria bacterium]|nr:5'-nucleotidase C-terminal domain-containing protein [Deltaproteobacteria bacterium]
MASLRTALAVAVLFAACHTDAPHTPRPPGPARGAQTITILGTQDLHGALERLPILAGYVDNVRAARKADGGAVVLVDAGDLFQGTLESNMTEGSPVIAAYNAMGYTAAAVGNHEFDFGPPGPAVTIQAADEDPRGALKERAAEARFPLLAANLYDAESNGRIKWPNMPASITVDENGVKVGIIGVTTEATPFTTMPANFKGLAIAAPATVITDEATRLRAAGAQIIIVAAHLGSKCKDFANPTDTSSCDQEEEVFKVAQALPHGLVDVIVAGHTHASVAHRINDIAVVQAYSSGRGLARVDLRVSASGVVTGSKIYPPRELCPLPEGADPSTPAPPPVADCHPGEYEGKPVVVSKAIAAVIAPALDKAKARREEPVGVELATGIPRAYDAESAQGNWFADLMLAARPDAQIAITNGGGLRADLAAGPLLYGALFEAMPFDNRFSLVTLEGKHLRKLVTNNLFGSSGIFSFAGMTVKATCAKGNLKVELFDAKGKPIGDDRSVTAVTSDFLASGGDGAIGRLGLPDGAVEVTDVLIRDAIADVLKKRGGKVSASDVFDPKKPRLAYPGPRPVKCSGS